MKRLTSTDKWKDSWFRKLSPITKLLWLYLIDNCDNSGVIELDFELAAFQIGQTVDEGHLAELGNRLYRLPSGKILVAKFIDFQYGPLNPESNLHKSVIKLAKRHCARESIPSEWHVNAIECHPDAVQTASISHKGPVKVKVQVQEGGLGETSRGPTFEQACDWLAVAIRNGADYTKAECHTAWLAMNANGWMWGKNPVTDWRSALERQIQTDRERSNHGTNSKNPKPSHDRNSGTYNEGKAHLYRKAAVSGKPLS